MNTYINFIIDDDVLESLQILSSEDSMLNKIKMAEYKYLSAQNIETNFTHFLYYYLGDFNRVEKHLDALRKLEKWCLKISNKDKKNAG